MLFGLSKARRSSRFLMKNPGGIGSYRTAELHRIQIHEAIPFSGKIMSPAPRISLARASVPDSQLDRAWVFGKLAVSSTRFASGHEALDQGPSPEFLQIHSCD